MPLLLQLDEQNNEIRESKLYTNRRDALGGRFSSLIYGTNLTNVVITGNNGTTDGQGSTWWKKFRAGEYNVTRPYMIEIINVLVKGLTILAPVDSPNTDGVNPDSCTNTRIEDCFIVSGDDCVAVKSGCDQYGIKVGIPTQHLIIRRLTCISRDSATIAVGSEMSGGIQDVRAEDITAIDTQSGVRIKTAVGRGAYVKDIDVRRMTLKTMKVIPFTGICISNAAITLTEKPEELLWNCTDISGVTSNVTPKPCALLPEKQGLNCPFPEYRLPIDDVQLKICSA
uniref:Polygalacturonase n=1 Tax=Quercus lobata TaxID=97700 RepID=A0A7N2MH72_QUELO